MSAQPSPLCGPGEHVVHVVEPTDEERELVALREVFDEARMSLNRIGTSHELPGDRLVLANALTALAYHAGLK